jgi:hypothetical protein
MKPMTSNTLIAIAIFLAAGISMVTLLSAQGTSKPAETSSHVQHTIAVGVLRSINTAEITYKMHHGCYAPWPVLLVESRSLNRLFQLAESQPPDHRLVEMGLAAGPEILPGRNLRLNVHADGQGYDLLLQDLTDKQCGYAAITDESGIIRQSQTIDCEL